MNAWSRIFPLAMLACASVGPSAWAQTESVLDPEMQSVLEAHAALGARPMETLTPAEARRQPSLAAAVRRLLEQDGDQPADLTAAAEAATIHAGPLALPARIYTPKGEGPFPVILYFHDGWVNGDLDAFDTTARALCGAVNAVVIAPQTRQAPEFKYPTAHIDALTVYHWLLRNEDRRSIDLTRVAVVGEGAGANLAVSLSLRARALGLPLPVHQVLIHPIVDLSGRRALASAEHAAAQPLSAAGVAWLTRHLLARPEDAVDPRLSLLRAGNALRGLPATTVVLAQVDPLRNEGEAFAQELKAHGVPVQMRAYPGVTHGFFGLADVVDKAREAQQFVGTNLTLAFRGGGSQYLRRLEGSLSGGLVKGTIKEFPDFIDEMNAKPAAAGK